MSTLCSEEQLNHMGYPIYSNLLMVTKMVFALKWRRYWDFVKTTNISYYACTVISPKYCFFIVMHFPTTNFLLNKLSSKLDDAGHCVRCWRTIFVFQCYRLLGTPNEDILRGIGKLLISRVPPMEGLEAAYYNSHSPR